MDTDDLAPDTIDGVPLERDDLALDAIDPDAPIEIRDMRDTWFWVHSALVDEWAPLLGPYGLTVYATLCSLADRETQTCYPSLARLASNWGISRTKVHACLTLLRRFGLLRVQRRVRADNATTSNLYQLCNPPPFREAVARSFRLMVGQGRDPEQAAAELRRLVPDDWRPLRPGKAAIQSAREWRALIDEIARDYQATPAQSTSLPTRLRGEREGALHEQGCLPDERGIPPDERAPIASRTPPTHLAHRGHPPGGHAPFLGRPRTTTRERDPLNNIRPNARPQQQSGGGVLLSEEELLARSLGPDEVVLPAGAGQVEVVHLEELARRDLRAEADGRERPSSVCWYSLAHYRGEGGDEWLPEEQWKVERLRVLTQRLRETLRQLGGFSVREVLLEQFGERLAQQYLAEEAAESRIGAWLRYVRSDAGKGLRNPRGFLRRKIESGEWPPERPDDLQRGGRR